jgi:hypothetical protein
MKISYSAILILLGFSIRFCIAIWNGFWGPSIGGDADALRFHDTAISLMTSGYDDLPLGFIYSSFLSLFYRVLGESIFLGSLLSVLAWTLSAYVLLKITNDLKFSSKQRFYSLLVYSLFPASIIFTSVTLREAYQLLFVNVLAFSAIRIYLGHKTMPLILMLFSIIALGTLHSALLGTGLVIGGLVLLLLFARRRKNFPWFKVILTLPVIIVLVAIGLKSYVHDGYRIDEGLDFAMQLYLEGGLATEARTHYHTEISIVGWWGILTFLPKSFLPYMLEPYPWHVANFFDLIVLLENVFRITLLVMGIKCFAESKKNLRMSLVIILFTYFSLEIIWSVGTLAWGTALRHHIPASGMLALLAFSYRRPRALERR